MGNTSGKALTYIHTKELTQERNPVNVVNIGRDSIRALSLCIHQTTHTREKPCKCNECGKHFSQNAN